MFDKNKEAFVAINQDKNIFILPRMANRHGLIAGATGTGKTVTLQTLTETFSQMGVPVFAADIKGDLSGVSNEGGNQSSVVKRVLEYKLEEQGYKYQTFPVEFWDVFGEGGIPFRVTIADIGPVLLSRILNLNDTQSSILTIVFKIAKEENLPLINLKDLQKTLEYIGKNINSYSVSYGNITSASLGIIQRGLFQLEHENGEVFFGEPALNIMDFIKTNSEGKGIVNILAADKLINSPKIYSSLLLWIMTRLFETLPEVGDLDKPKLVFFFDEAHLLFNDAPKVLVEKIEQVVRLIRSKGVGVYFVTQSPSDIPDNVLGQLGNRVQHALRAYTPKDQKNLKVAAQTFRVNPLFKTEDAISELGTGEALVSFLDEKGRPQPVERVFILPPQGQVGPITQAERSAVIKSSVFYSSYLNSIDRESAYEILSKRQEDTVKQNEAVVEEKQKHKTLKEQREEEKKETQAAKKQDKMVGKIVDKVVLPVARQVMKSLFGGFGKKGK